MNDEKDNLYAIINKNRNRYARKFPSFYLDPIRLGLEIEHIDKMYNELNEFFRIFKINNDKEQELKTFLNCLIVKSIMHYLNSYLKIQYKAKNENINENILYLKSKVKPFIKDVDVYLKQNYINIINFQDEIDISVLNEYIKIIIKELPKDNCKKLIDSMNDNLFTSVLHFLKANNKTLFPAIFKLVKQVNLLDKYVLSDILMSIYSLKNYEFDDWEKKEYAEMINIFCDKLNIYLKNNPNINNFYDNPTNIFECIYKRAKLNRVDYEEIRISLINKEKELERELLKNGKIISSKLDFTKYKDLLLTKNNFNLMELTYLFIELTHNSKGELNMFLISSNNNASSLINSLINGKYESYDSWYKPSNIFYFENNWGIYSHSLQLQFFSLDYILQFLENHLFTIIYYFLINGNQILNNTSTIEGIENLIKLLTLAKNGMYSYIQYSLIVCTVNLIENIFKNILGKKNEESKLSNLLEDKKLNDFFDLNLLNFIRYIFLKVYVNEDNSFHGFDLRNKIMHGEFIIDSGIDFIKVIYLLFCIFNEIYIKHVKKL